MTLLPQRSLKLEVNEKVVTLTIGEDKLSREFEGSNGAASTYSMLAEEIKKQLALGMR